MAKKILIIRFSSFGDIVQALSAVNFLVDIPDYEITFLTKKEFSAMVSIHPSIKAVWKFDRRSGIRGLWSLSRVIVESDFAIIYDAHATLRTLLLKLFIRLHQPQITAKWIVRHKKRWKRFRYFVLKQREIFSMPYKGAVSYVGPLMNLPEFSTLKFNFDRYISWSFTREMEAELDRKFLNKILPEQHFITLAPSAAWEMKRWPLIYWKKIITLLPNFQFLILGGPEDAFCQELAAVDPLRVINTAGKTSLLESCCLVFQSEFVISADTGILHVADLFHIDGVALIGPTAFGYPTGNRMQVLEVNLPCKPCSKDGRGKCVQDTFQRCMVEISPESVVDKVLEFFKDIPNSKDHRII